MKFSTFQELAIPLAANEETKRPLYGSFLRVIAATDDFEVGVSGEDWLSGFTGLGLASEVDTATGERPMFEELRFKETKGAPNSIRIIVGTGQIFDDRVVFGGTNVPVDIQNISGGLLPNVYSPGAPKIVPAGGAVTLSWPDVRRRRAVYKNVGSSDVALSTGTSFIGHVLSPGEIFETQCTGQLNAVSGGPEGKVSVLEERAV